MSSKNIYEHARVIYKKLQKELCSGLYYYVVYEIPAFHRNMLLL